VEENPVGRAVRAGFGVAVYASPVFVSPLGAHMPVSAPRTPRHLNRVDARWRLSARMARRVRRPGPRLATSDPPTRIRARRVARRTRHHAARRTRHRTNRRRDVDLRGRRPDTVQSRVEVRQVVRNRRSRVVLRRRLRSTSPAPPRLRRKPAHHGDATGSQTDDVPAECVPHRRRTGATRTGASMTTRWVVTLVRHGDDTAVSASR
jgi:hypothetical protein